MGWILFETANGFIISYGNSEPTVNAGEDKLQSNQSFLGFQNLNEWKLNGGKIEKCTEDEVLNRGAEYEIEKDVSVVPESVFDINYKIGLKSGVGYTSVFIKHESGINSGLVDKTEYYKDYVDQDNKGQLILVVSEVYIIDDSTPSLPNSAKPALERVKTWKHVKKGKSTPDEGNKKTKPKKYDTREKRHIEGERRRENIMESYIDHIGTAGVLSGAFLDENDAYNKLTSIQTIHSNAFTSWLNSGRDPLYTDLENDAFTSWFDIVVPDNANTNFMIPWMIGMTLRNYTIEKLKGNIK